MGALTVVLIERKRASWLLHDEREIGMYADGTRDDELCMVQQENLPLITRYTVETAHLVQLLVRLYGMRLCTCPHP